MDNLKIIRKYNKYLNKINLIQKGGFECIVCYTNGSEINQNDNLFECSSCNVVVCSECLSFIENKCPQEKKITIWKIIPKTHTDYNNEFRNTKQVEAVDEEQKRILERVQERARIEEQELRKRSEQTNRTRVQLPVLDNPLIPSLNVDDIPLFASSESIPVNQHNDPRISNFDFSLHTSTVRPQPEYVRELDRIMRDERNNERIRREMERQQQRRQRR
jgi:hypothetical protein